MPLPAISRRRALAAASWTTPAVIAASAAPSFARSGTATARVAYTLDWATSGFIAGSNPYAVARPDDSSLGAPDLILGIATRNTSIGSAAVWESAGGDDLTIASVPSVQGRRPLTLSSTTKSAKVGAAQLYQPHRFLELTPHGFSMRRVSVSIGGLTHRCSGHGVFYAYSVHANTDAVVFTQGATLLARTLPMSTTSPSISWDSAGAFGHFVPTASGENEATFAARDDEPLAGALGNVAQPLNIAVFNRCEGWGVSDGNEWRDHTATTVSIGAITFLADVEVPAG